VRNDAGFQLPSLVSKFPSSSPTVGAHLAGLQVLTSGFVDAQTFSIGTAVAREGFQIRACKVAEKHMDSYLMK